MITKLKKTILALAALVAIVAPVLAPVAVYAAPATSATKCGVNQGAELSLSGGTNCAVASTGANGLNDLVKKIVNILSAIVGVIAVIMIIIGGLKYITSGGESSNVSGAKNTIIYAVVGLIVVALAQFIVRFVLTNTNSLSS